MSEHIDRFTLEAYVEQVLPAVQRRTVEAHLTSCSTCQARLANAKQIPALLYSLPRERPTPNLAARINAAIAVQHAPAKARWMRALVPAAFVVGLVLLALAAPQWSGWVLAASSAQLPTDQAVMTWLANLATDPAATLDTLLTFAEQMLTGPGEEMGALMTAATMLLASASVAWLAQLLGGEHPLTTAAGASG
jgi:anti-sigma factor RsiW